MESGNTDRENKKNHEEVAPLKRHHPGPQYFVSPFRTPDSEAKQPRSRHPEVGIAVRTNSIVFCAGQVSMNANEKKTSRRTIHTWEEWDEHSHIITKHLLQIPLHSDIERRMGHLSGRRKNSGGSHKHQLPGIQHQTIKRHVSIIARTGTHGIIRESIVEEFQSRFVLVDQENVPEQKHGRRESCRTAQDHRDHDSLRMFSSLSSQEENRRMVEGR